MTEMNTRLWNEWRARGDAGAFARLVRPEMGYVLALARRAGCDAVEAEDVLQDALTRLVAEGGSGPEQIGLRVWLYRTVRTIARSRIRGHVRRRDRERRAARPEAIAPRRGRLEVQEEVEAALALLSEDDREIVLLRHLHDLEYGDVATVLGISLTAARVRSHRAMGRLRERLGARAPALLGALPLPVVVDPTLFAKQALAAAAAKSTGVSTGGVVAMAASNKLIIAAVVVAGTAGWFGSLALAPSHNVAAIPEAVAKGPDASSTEGGSARDGALDDASRRRRRVGTDGASTVAERFVRDSGVQEDELEFLREALLAERVRRAGARIRTDDNGVDILRRVLDHGADLREEMWDFAAFGARVKTGEGDVATVTSDSPDDVQDVSLDEIAGDARVITFGPGTFRIRRSAWGNMTAAKPYLSLEIRGAGKDKTTLIGATNTFVGISDGLENLRIRDLTFDGGERGDLLLSIRGETAVILERVRVRNWSQGGHSAPIGLNGRAYLGAKDCEFVGRLDDGGIMVFSIRGKAVALFDSCSFLDSIMTMRGWEGGAVGSVVHFNECTWENTLLTDALRFGPEQEVEFAVRVRGGTVRFGREGLDDDARVADWGGDVLAEMEGVSFEAGVPRCRVSDLLALLDAFRVGEGERVSSVKFVYTRPDGPRHFDVGIAGPGLHDREHVRVAFESGRVTRLGQPDDRPTPLPHDQIATTVDLATAVRSSGMPLDAGLTWLRYTQWSENDRPLMTVAVGGRWSQGRWLLDATSGRVVQKPYDAE